MYTIINKRYPMFASLLLIVGVFVALLWIYNLVLVALLLSIIITSVLVIFAIKNNKRLMPAILLVIFIIGIAVTTIDYVITSNSYINRTYGTVKGTVRESKAINGGVRVILDDPYIEDHEIRLNKAVTATIFGDDIDVDTIAIGNILYVTGYVDNVYLYKDSINSYAYKNSIGYSVEDGFVLKMDVGKSNIVTDIRNYIRKTLFGSMDNGGIAYALLVGDKTYVDGDEYGAMRDSGVVHLLAVSGLHVGFVVGIFDKLLSVFKLKYKYKLPIIIIPLIIYAYICNFPPSVIRAIIMTFIMLLAKALYAKPDLLNSMSIAMLLIIVFKPLFLFDVGFVLSFAAVFGIATLTAYLNRIFVNKIKNKVLRYFVGIITVSVGATVSTLGFVANYFGSVSLMGIVTNIVAIPLVTIAFVCCIVGLLPYMSWLLFVSDKLLGLLTIATAEISSWSFAVINVGYIGISVLILLTLLFVVGGFVRLRGKSKYIVCGILAVVFVLSSAIYIVPKSIKNEIHILATYSDLLVIIEDTRDDDLHVVSNISSSYDIDAIIDSVSRIKYKSVHLHVPSIRNVRKALLDRLMISVSVGNLYYYDGYGNK